MLPLSNLKGPYLLRREPFGKQTTTKSPKALIKLVAPGLYNWENFTEFDFLIIVGHGAEMSQDTSHYCPGHWAGIGMGQVAVVGYPHSLPTTQPALAKR